MHESSRNHLGLSVSVALHAILLAALLILWRAPSLAPTTLNPNTISVQLLKLPPTTAIETPNIEKRSSDERKNQVATTIKTPVTVEADPVLAPTITAEVPANNNPITGNPTTLPQSSKREGDWGLSKDQKAQALRQKSLAQQAREQVGTKQKTEQEVLAMSIERSAKPSCFGDRGMGLFNAPFILSDIAKDKCKWD